MQACGRHDNSAFSSGAYFYEPTLICWYMLFSVDYSFGMSHFGMLPPTACKILYWCLDSPEIQDPKIETRNFKVDSISPAETETAATQESDEKPQPSKKHDRVFIPLIGTAY